MSAHAQKEPGILKLTITMMLVTGIAGVILGIVAYFTVPIQIKNDKIHKQEILQKTLPEARQFIKLDIPVDPHAHGKPNPWFKGVDESGKLVGYVVQTDHRGYGGAVELTVGITNDMKIKGYEVLHHNETPGLGDQIKKENFKAQFVGKNSEQLVITKRGEPGKINAITGATITTRAVVGGIKASLEKLNQTLSTQ
jgi:electron transport complex protein RnfG